MKTIPATRSFAQQQYPAWGLVRRSTLMHKMSAAVVVWVLIIAMVRGGPAPKAAPVSPNQLGVKRDETSALVSLTPMVEITGGVYWFGSQLVYKDKFMPAVNKDGAEPRKRVNVKSFLLQEDCVTNAQFEEFAAHTHYVTEAEQFGWSFVLDPQASDAVRAEVDGKTGMGRVKTAKHWMAVRGANWRHPHGPDSSVVDLLDHPVVHISHTDATEYCAWASMRLPSEREWEYAARGGLKNVTYPWGEDYEEGRMNIWHGAFPNENLVLDGHYGTAAVKSFEPNVYGAYNMLGNVWEWTKGGTPEKRVLRGGSFIDSRDGTHNHMVIVSTRQVNTGDSGASNSGFRCAKSKPKTTSSDEL